MFLEKGKMKASFTLVSAVRYSEMKCQINRPLAAVNKLILLFIRAIEHHNTLDSCCL